MENTKSCPNCGSRILPCDSLFCPNCGNKIDENVQINQTGTNQGTQVHENYYPNTYPTYVQPVKKKKTGLIVGIVILVVFFLAAIGMLAENFAKNYTNSDVEYTQGSFTSSTYESEFIGVRYTIPEGWKMLDEDKLSEISSDERMNVEMQAVSEEDGSNIIIGVEELPSKTVSMSRYIESFEENLKKNVSVNVSNIKKKGTEIIAGEEYTVITCVSKPLLGPSCYQTLYFRKIGKYMVNITVTKIYTPVSTIMEGFEKY